MDRLKTWQKVLVGFGIAVVALILLALFLPADFRWGAALPMTLFVAYMARLGSDYMNRNNRPSREIDNPK